MVNPDIFHDVFVKNIPSKCFEPKRSDNVKVIFNDFQSLLEFLEESGIQLELNGSTVEGEDSKIFVCPYACGTHSFGLTQFERYKTYFSVRGWKPIFFSTALHINFKRYQYADQVLLFIKRAVDGEIDGDKCIFYNVVIPNCKSNNVVYLNDNGGTPILGEESWVPSIFLGVHCSSNPFIYHRTSTGKLENVTFGFHPFQTIGNKLQWAVQETFVPQSNKQTKHRPEQFKILSTAPNQQEINIGRLKQKWLLFKHEEGWALCQVIRKNFQEKKKQSCAIPIHCQVQ